MYIHFWSDMYNITGKGNAPSPPTKTRIYIIIYIYIYKHEQLKRNERSPNRCKV